MSNTWQDLKSVISEHVDTLKTDLTQIYKSDYENKTVHVLVKFKDNAKDALVTIAHSKNTDAKSELSISLANSKNLKKRFENLLSEFQNKVK